MELPHNWNPRHYQLKSWRAWERGIKRDLLIWHRRAGKDDVAMHKIAVAAHPPPTGAMANQRVANYWHCLPLYEQARKAIWEAVNPHTGKRRIDEAFPRELRARTDNSSMVIEFKSGSTYRVVGSDNPDSLVGAAPFGLVFSEWDLSNPSVWPYLAPILNENNGWASFITTPRGRGNAFHMFTEHQGDPNWFCERLTVDDTKFILRDRIEEDRKTYQAMFGEEAADALIEQEYWCSFEAAILGAYYGKEMTRAEQEGRITAVEPWPGVPVHTAWDLGVSRGGDTMTIWLWQVVPSEVGRSQVRVLDYVSGSGYSVQYYAEQLRERRKTIASATKTPLDTIRGVDWVPHDAKVPEMTSSGPGGHAKLRITVMEECGLKPKVVTNHHVSDGIQAVRQLLPRCWFDKGKTERKGIECLRQYQREWDDEKKTFRPTALNNWASHGADAFRYLAMAFRELRRDEQPQEPGRIVQIGAQPPVNQITLNDLWKAQSPRRASRI